MYFNIGRKYISKKVTDGVKTSVYTNKYTTLIYLFCKYINGHPKERVFNTYLVIDLNITILKILVKAYILKVSEIFRELVKSESLIFKTLQNLQH